VFQGQATIHLLQVKEWVFLVQWQGLETIHSMQLKVWRDLELQDLVRQDLDLDLKVELIVREQDQPAAELVRGLPERNQDLVAVHPEVDSLLADQLEVEVAVLAAEPPELLVRVEQEDRARLVSPSAQSAKNLNKEVSRALVAQLCHAATEPQLSGFAAVLRFKTSQTRLMPMPVS
jgi:hypothetical protein